MNAPNKKLRKLRSKLGMSQNALAKELRKRKMRCAGWDTVSRWERGVNKPPPYLWDVMKELLDIPLD